ncbi:MAG: hypothetical protein KatS3mg031_1194 [Chitinophagales bacterium]|nr:MAG: hypothetical protein KatS3mg031_1194 [Chitinophagales bacterium]
MTSGSAWILLRMITLKNEVTLSAVKVVTALAFLTGMLLSARLWITDRSFPLVPFWEWIPILRPPADYVLTGLMAVLLCVIIVFRKHTLPVFLFLAVYLTVAVQDQNRLQPYYYMYCLILLATCISQRNQEQKTEIALNTIRLLFFGVYFWSGIHKMNMQFAGRILTTANHLLPAYMTDFAFGQHVMLLIPALETSLALGLLYSRTRRISVFLLVCMHLIIITGLLLKRWNLIVIPWNAALIVLVIILFGEKKYFSSVGKIFSPERSLIKAAIFVLVILMPAFNFIGYWDHYLSFSLYSNKAPYAIIYLGEDHVQSLSAPVRQHVKTMHGKPYLDLTYWLIDETNTVPYPERRVYNKVYEYVCGFYTDSCQAELKIYKGQQELY